MIEVFEGRIGGGKTYSAVERMLKYLGQGGCVFSNIELKIPAVRKVLLERYRWDFQDSQYTFLSDNQIPEFHLHTSAGTPECPTLVVIDEAHIWFNARDWSHTSRELLSFLTQSRKQSTDIIFISQSLLNMDKQFMRLVQYVWVFHDLKKKGFPIGLPFFPTLPWPFSQILQIQYGEDGKTFVDRFFVMKKIEIFSCYDTFVLLRKFPRLESLKTDYRSTARIKYSYAEYFRRLAPLASMLLVFLFGTGCRFVQVNDVRKENKELKMRIISLEKQIAFKNIPVQRSPSLTNQTLSSSISLPTNIIHVVAVVTGKVGLSDGRWVIIGDSHVSKGRLIACNPSSGSVCWDRDGIYSYEYL